MGMDESNKRIPKTASLEELPRFWQTHDLTDLEDELEEAMEPVFVRNEESEQIKKRHSDLSRLKDGKEL